MKRGWFGAALLAALLGLGIFSSLGMGLFHEPLSELMERASEQALAENWERAGDLAEQAEEKWEDVWHFSAAFADHGPMEEIDDCFAQLEVYENIRDKVGFAAVCASLSRQLEDMADAHALRWWNLL